MKITTKKEAAPKPTKEKMTLSILAFVSSPLNICLWCLCSTSTNIWKRNVSILLRLSKRITLSSDWDLRRRLMMMIWCVHPWTWTTFLHLAHPLTGRCHQRKMINLWQQLLLLHGLGSSSSCPPRMRCFDCVNFILWSWNQKQIYCYHHLEYQQLSFENPGSKLNVLLCFMSKYNGYSCIKVLLMRPNRTVISSTCLWSLTSI